MIDINLLRKNFDETAKRIRDRNRPYPQLDEFTEVDNE
jgi:seryl-tRNA synthetase